MSILDRINSIKAKPAARYTLMEVVNLIADMVKELYNGGVPLRGLRNKLMISVVILMLILINN